MTGPLMPAADLPMCPECKGRGVTQAGNNGRGRVATCTPCFGMGRVMPPVDPQVKP